MYDEMVAEVISEVMACGLSLAHDMDAVVDMVRPRAAMFAEPEAGWFMADVLNGINEREMALE